MIISKYKDLINQLEAKKFKRISIVEILARNNLSNYMNRKWIAMNIIQLKVLCMKNDIDFLEITIDKDAMLDRRGLPHTLQNSKSSRHRWHAFRIY